MYKEKFVAHSKSLHSFFIITTPLNQILCQFQLAIANHHEVSVIFARLQLHNTVYIHLFDMMDCKAMVPSMLRSLRLACSTNHDHEYYSAIANTSTGKGYIS